MLKIPMANEQMWPDKKAVFRTSGDGNKIGRESAGGCVSMAASKSGVVRSVYLGASRKVGVNTRLHA